jgi:hypothetical protein
MNSSSALVSRALGAAALTLTGLSGLTAVAPTVSATDGCPPAAPLSAATKDAPVTGWTVSSGTEPEQFTGSVIGVLNDGIAPGLDMIMATLDSPELERVGGIWAGMSGSPVYTADGKLLGAVSYGLSIGPSRVAGITPAAEMYALLDDGSTAAGANQVRLTSTLRNRLVASGTATTTQADSGMSRLPVPLAVSGLSPERRADSRVMSRLAPPGTRPYAAASAPVTGAATDDPAATIVAGSNLAAGLSYGDLSTIAMGTATAVCGDKVLGFGHPFLFTGKSTESMHGGNALYVQDDPAGTPFKLANPTGPIGTIVQDRLAGIVGTTTGTPSTIGVTSSITSQNRSRDGRTDVVEADQLPDLAAFHLLANEDRVFDEIGAGVATYTTTVTGRHGDGSPWTFRRSDRVADPSDLSFATVFPIYNAITSIQYNGLDDVDIDSVDVDADMSPDYTDYSIGRVQYRAPDGVWRTPTERRPAVVASGDRLRLRVQLVGHLGSGSQVVPLSLKVPARSAGSSGALQVTGGGFGFGDGFSDGPPSSTAKTFDGLLADMQNAPRADQLLTTFSLGGAFGPKGPIGPPSVVTENRRQLDRVVLGGKLLPVQVIRPAAAKPGVVSGHRWTLSTGFATGAPRFAVRFPTTGTPLTGDFDGDGATTQATFRDGVWRIEPSASSSSTVTVHFGRPGDQPVVGDWNGDGNDEIGVLRGGTFLLRSGIGAADGARTVQLPTGLTGRPVAADWRGAGYDTVGVFHRGTWTILQRNRTGAGTRTVVFGARAGVPVVGDWNADGRAGIGVYRRGVWSIRQTVSAGPPVRTFAFGSETTLPIIWR